MQWTPARAVLAAAVLFALTASAQGFVLFPFGSTWKYYASGDAGTAWTAIAFDDSSWLSGDGEFGFGDNDETTRVNTDTNTQYYRKTVTMTEARGYTGATVSIIRDDGAIAYVNGVEVGRTNMPDGPAPYGTAAADALAGADESTPVSIPIPDNVWVVGTNVVAIAVYNFRSTSSDLSFDAQVDAQEAPSPSPAPPTSFEEVTVPKNSNFKYLADGSDLAGTAWTTLVFNDNSWPSGNAPLGYGDTLTTEVARNGLTVYFRHTFTVPFVERVEDGFMSVMRDDGIVCYINGAEVVRDNMPAGEINAETRARTGIGGADETRFFGGFNFDSTILQSGDNLLACEVHQQSPESSDLGFDAELTLNLLINFDQPTPSNSPPPSPAASVAASTSPSMTRSATRSPTSSLPPGVTPSTTPSATTTPVAGTSPVPVSPTSSNSPTPSASSAGGNDGNVCTSCSCACLTACPAGDPIIAACNNAKSDGGSDNTVVIVASVVLVVAAVAAASAFVFFRRRQTKNVKRASGAKASGALMLEDVDVEAGDGAGAAAGAGASHKRDRKDRKDRKDRDRKDRDKDKDRKSRSKSRRHRDKDGDAKDDGDHKHRSKSRHRSRKDKDEGGDDKHRSKSRHRSRKDKDEGGDDKHRSKSRSRKDDDKHRSRSSRKDGEHRSSRKDKESKHRSKSPRKEGRSSPRH